MNPVIKPSVINILSGNSSPDFKLKYDNPPKPKPKQVSFWSKVCKFIKEGIPIITSALAAIPPIINAILDIRNSSMQKDRYVKRGTA